MFSIESLTLVVCRSLKKWSTKLLCHHWKIIGIFHVCAQNDIWWTQIFKDCWIHLQFKIKLKLFGGLLLLFTFFLLLSHFIQHSEEKLFLHSQTLQSWTYCNIFSDIVNAEVCFVYLFLFIISQSSFHLKGGFIFKLFNNHPFWMMYSSLRF